MKKLLALLVALASLSCFTACNDDEKESKSSRTEESKVVSTDSETEEEAEEETEPTTEKTTEKKVECETYEDDYIVFDYPKDVTKIKQDDIILFSDNKKINLTYSKHKNEERYGESFIYDYVEYEKEQGDDVSLKYYTTHSSIAFPCSYKLIDDPEGKRKRYLFINGDYTYIFTADFETDEEILTNIFKSIRFKEEDDIPQTEPATEAKTEKPTEKPTEPPKPAYSFESFTVSGTGDTVLSDISIPAVYNIFNGSHNGKSNFIAKFYDCNGDSKLLINEIGKYSCSQVFNATKIDDSSAGMLEIVADGSWSITFSPVQEIVNSNVSNSFNGTGSTITGAFKSNGNMICSATHDGKSNFIVQAYELSDDGDRETAFNEIGVYNGQCIIKTKKDSLYFFNVIADGNWTINLE